MLKDINEEVFYILNINLISSYNYLKCLLFLMMFIIITSIGIFVILQFFFNCNMENILFQL